MKIKHQGIAPTLAGSRAQVPPAVPDLGALSSLKRVELLSTLEDNKKTEFDEDAFSRMKSLKPSSELSDWDALLPRSPNQNLFPADGSRAVVPNPAARCELNGVENLKNIWTHRPSSPHSLVGGAFTSRGQWQDHVLPYV